MSLITRCPACGTMFKVVADQLKISQGWVRCGQCAEVFDAAAHLQPRVAPEAMATAPTSAPTSGQTAFAATPLNKPPEAVAPLSSLLRVPEAPAAAVEPAPALKPIVKARAVDVQTPAPSVPEVEASMPPDLAADVFASSVNPDPYAQADLAPPEPPAPLDESDVGESGAPVLPQQDVSFVRDARRQAFWRRPAMRGWLGGIALLLLAALMLQVALFQRNALAARQPGLRSGLQTLCGYLHCEVQPLRHIEAIAIDSSSFNRIAPDAYRLKVVLKNTGSVALAMPSVELTLTDTQDHALLRRVLAPVEFGIGANTLAGGAEFSGVLSMTVSNLVPPPLDGASAPVQKPPASLRIAGYRVLAFYP